jgi:hypothetical protein
LARAGAWQHKVLSFLAAFVFLAGAITPLGHQAKAREAAAGSAAQLQTLLGVSAEELGASICHHEDGSASELPSDEESQLCKEHCALFLALQHHAPAFIPGGLAWPVRGQTAAAAPFAYGATLKISSEPAGQARPRAPPAA